MANRPLSPVLFVVEDRGHVTPCHVWQRATNGAGYGVVRDGRRLVLAHRQAYERATGRPLDPAAKLDHRCRVTACVRADHLEPVTHAENIRRGSSAKLTWGDVDEIRARLDRGEPAADVAADYPVHVLTVRRIGARTRWWAA